MLTISNFQKPNKASLNWTLQRKLELRAIKTLTQGQFGNGDCVGVTLIQLVCFWLWILFNFWNSIFPAVFKKKHQFCCKIWATSTATQTDDKMFWKIIPFFENIYQLRIKIIKIIFRKLQFSLVLQGSAC